MNQIQLGNITAIVGMFIVVANHYNLGFSQTEIEALIGGITVIVGIVYSYFVTKRTANLTTLGYPKA